MTPPSTTPPDNGQANQPCPQFECERLVRAMHKALLGTFEQEGFIHRTNERLDVLEAPRRAWENWKANAASTSLNWVVTAVLGVLCAGGGALASQLWSRYASGP